MALYLSWLLIPATVVDVDHLQTVIPVVAIDKQDGAVGAGHVEKELPVPRMR